MAFKRKPPPHNVRRVVCLGSNCRGVTTNKRGRLVQFESEQERKLILLLERDATVADYCSQPETFTFTTAEGRRCHYTPDFQVWRTDGRIEMHEVTLEARRQTHGTRPPRELAALAVCHIRGWHYLVYTDQTLPTGYEYANLDILSAFRSASYANPSCAAFWRDQLAGQGAVHPHAILLRADAAHQTGRLASCLYHLLWHDQVQMDWQRPLLWRGDFHVAARIWLPPAPTCREGRPL